LITSIRLPGEERVQVLYHFYRQAVLNYEVAGLHQTHGNVLVGTVYCAVFRDI
jgi:hypothetical protein